MTVEEPRVKVQREPRRQMRRQPAWITVEDGMTKLECFVLDVSPGGARIVTDAAMDVRDTFGLALVPDHPKRQSCEVVWRRGRTYGIKFVSDAGHPAPPNAWADLPKVLDLAKRPNVVIKVSGACTLSHQPYPFEDIWEPLRRIFDAWGFERCLWGTDWTRAFAVVNYEQAVAPFLETSRLSDTERAMLMGGACAKAYGWSPKKG